MLPQAYDSLEPTGRKKTVCVKLVEMFKTAIQYRQLVLSLSRSVNPRICTFDVRIQIHVSPVQRNFKFYILFWINQNATCLNTYSIKFTICWINIYVNKTNNWNKRKHHLILLNVNIQRKQLCTNILGTSELWDETQANSITLKF